LKAQTSQTQAMSLEFCFNYANSDQSGFEIEEVNGGFGPFIEASQELMKECKLWSSFVAQYRADRPTDEDSDEVLVESEPPSEGEVEGLLDAFGEWGPSKPFDADELRQWAKRWIVLLQVLEDEEAEVIFAGDNRLYRRDGEYGRNWSTGEMKRLIAMAECAMRHNVGLTMSCNSD
jgi:hypothetical protein